MINKKNSHKIMFTGNFIFRSLLVLSRPAPEPELFG